MSSSVTSALRIDTLAFARRLKDAGADERLAEAIVEGLAVADISHLATKDDLAEVRAELKNEIAGVKAELKAEIAGVKAELKDEIAGVRAEIAGVRTEIAKSSNRILFAFVAFTGAIVVTLIGGFMAVLA